MAIWMSLQFRHYVCEYSAAGVGWKLLAYLDPSIFSGHYHHYYAYRWIKQSLVSKGDMKKCHVFLAEWFYCLLFLFS